MKIEGSHQLLADRERVFRALMDPEVLKRCIPGCEKLEKTAQDEYSAWLRAGIGAIKGVFSGKIRLEDINPPERYKMIIEGKGQPGFIKGAGAITLEESGNATIIRYSGDVQVGGTLAGIGQRMIEGAAKMMAYQFFMAIEAEARANPDSPPLKHGFFRTTLRWISGLFRSKTTSPPKCP
jgi:hypothetical protein